MSKEKLWMAMVTNENEVIFSKPWKSKRQAEIAIVAYLRENENFDGDSFSDACSWIAENDLRLDLSVFPMESEDFESTCSGYTIEPPPKGKNQFRVIYEKDVFGSSHVNAAQKVWKILHNPDLVAPVLTVIDTKGQIDRIDLLNVLEFNKITPGFVTQRYRKGDDGKYQCLWQEFTAGDDVQYENPKGEPIDPPNYDYQEFNMTLLSVSKIVYFIQEVLKTLDVGGEQSRQFADEIRILSRLISELDRTKK